MSQVSLPVVAVSEIETVRRSRSKEADGPTVDAHSTSEKIAESPAKEFPQVDNMSLAQIAVLLLGLGLSLFLFAIDETIVATSVSTIGSELGIKDSLTWITSSYLLTTTVILPITGRIADAVDIKTFIIVELWIFVIGNIIVGTAHGFAQLVAGRLISGVGGAGLLNLTCIIIAKMTTEKQRGAYMNLVNGVFIVSDSLGPVVGGALAHAGQWRWIFLLAAPFGPVITVFIYFTLRTPPPPARVHSFHQLVTTVDLLGMFLVVTFLSLLVIALNMGGQDLPWDDSVIIGCLAGAGVAFVFFILVERRAEMPIVPIELFTKWKWRNVPIMTLLRILSFFHIFALTFYLPVFLQVIDVPTITASALIIPFLLMASLSSTATSWFMTRCKTGLQLRALFIVPLAVLVTGLVSPNDNFLIGALNLGDQSLMATLTERSSIGHIVGYSMICGIGFGSATQITMVIAQLGLPADYLSTTTALVGTAPLLGGTLGVAILGSAINNIYRDSLVTSPYASALTDLNPNSVVETLQHLLEGSEEYDAVVGAYVKAWRMGCWILVGITGLEIFLCLGIKAVSFDDRPEEKRSEEHETPV